MQRRIQGWGLAFVLVLVGVLGAVRPAAAQVGGLPTVVQPPSARFDIHGSLRVGSTGGSSSIGDITAMIGGSGSQSGTNLQEDVTISLMLPDLPGLTDPSAPSTGITLTTSTILVDGKYYTRVSGAGGSDEGQWYVLDLSTLPGASDMMGNPLGSLVGVDPMMAAQYASAFTVQQTGKETISGGPTTKYQIDVDLPKLYAAMGVTQTAETAALIQNGKLVMYMWVGDNDQYLYQMQETLVSQTTDPATNTTTSLGMDLTITYRDFGAAITITAPPNAVPLDVSGGAAGTTGLTGIIGSAVPGMPTTAMPGMPSIAPVPSTAPPVIAPVPGMPRTGNSDPVGAGGLLALGLLCVGAGLLARRRAVTVR